METLIALFAYAIPVAIIITFLFLWIDKKVNNDRRYQRIEGWLVFLRFVIVIAALTGLIMVPARVYDYYEGDYEYTRHAYKTSKLFSLKSNSELNGSFILGTGVINERSYYYFYYQTADGGMKLDKVGTNDAVLYETTGTPHIEDWGRFEDFYKYDTLVKADAKFWSCDCSYKLYIPKGTITEKINPFDL